MLKLYAFSVVMDAPRGYKHSAGCVFANDEAQAEGRALILSRETFPYPEYSRHSVEIYEIPEEKILAMGYKK